MRQLVFVIMVLALAINVAAQEEETLFKGNFEKGGFGGPVVKFISIKGQSAAMIGGRGGWIINHSLALGGGGYGVASEVDAPAGVLPLEGPLDIEFGYVGFELEYIIHPKSLAHFSIYTLIGGGATNYVNDVGPVTESNEQVGETDFLFVWEPAVNAELNVTTWFRLNAGVSYRLVTGVKQEGLENRDFRGMAATLTFKFGKF
ncbi:MAG TPA: hypothetical protein VGD14_25075 [bacterium]